MRSNILQYQSSIYGIQILCVLIRLCLCLYPLQRNLYTKFGIFSEILQLLSNTYRIFSTFVCSFSDEDVIIQTCDLFSWQDKGKMILPTLFKCKNIKHAFYLNLTHFWHDAVVYNF